MSWLRRLLGSSPAPAGAPDAAAVGPLADGALDGDGLLDADGLLDDGAVFVCTTCGRTDLPEAGDWDPPICLECDAAINFAAIEEVEITQDW